MSSIKMVRLSSGEEIICKWRVDKDADSKIHILKDAAILFPMGQGKLAFAKWMPYVSEEQHKYGITVPEKFVMFVVDIDAEMEKQYQSMISGLVVPSNGPVSGGPLGAGLKLTT
jgi:hypothetical protein